MGDREALWEQNRKFIEACRRGSWEMLSPILSPGFSYTDGRTGEVWPLDRYIQDLRSHPAPDLAIDQVVVHVDGDAAIVSARSSSRPGQHNRYVDTYARRDGAWTCIHASVWPLAAEEPPPPKEGSRHAPA